MLSRNLSFNKLGNKKKKTYPFLKYLKYLRGGGYFLVPPERKNERYDEKII